MSLITKSGLLYQNMRCVNHLNKLVCICQLDLRDMKIRLQLVKCSEHRRFEVINQRLPVTRELSSCCGTENRREVQHQSLPPPPQLGFSQLGAIRLAYSCLLGAQPCVCHQTKCLQPPCPNFPHVSTRFCVRACVCACAHMLVRTTWNTTSSQPTAQS